MASGTIIETPLPRDTAETVFRLDLPGIAYDGVPSVRNQITQFLSEQSLSQEQTGRIALSVTEILTNLAKHPPEKASVIGIRLRLQRKSVFADIFDNSTPFQEYEAKCKTALARLNAAGLMAESGYGLGIILKQHAMTGYTPAGDSPDGFNHFRLRDDAELLPGAGRKSTLFLIDDDPVAMKRHCMMLEDSYTLMPFGRAEEAVKAFAKTKPDLVISDINMPGMDGLALRLALSELEGGNATPFIFLSGETQQQNSAYISEMGVDDFLCKPVEKRKLQTVVARLITRSTQVRQSLEGRFQQHLTRMLKPDLPLQYGAWNMVTLTEAAEAGGGDFTLHHETPAHFMAVLADVMGHGPQAKFFSYAYAGYLRSLFRLQTDAPDPAQFLKALSQSIEGDAFLESILLTCQSFQLHPKGMIRIASAGHPAPIWLRASGAENIPVAGPLPALASARPYNLQTLELQDGEKVIFATDGFLQAFEAEGIRRGALFKILDGLAGASAAQASEVLWHAYRARKPLSRAQDDATLIIAEYGGNT